MRKSPYLYFEYAVAVKGEYHEVKKLVYILDKSKRIASQKLFFLLHNVKELNRFNEYKLTEVLKPSELVEMQNGMLILSG